MQDLKVAVRYAPMAAVAGDFYGFLGVDAKRLGILVADVMGHGVPAAPVASTIKVAISAQVANASNPARVISGVNETLCRQVRGQLSTACYLFMDAETRKATYSAAGHPPLLLWQRANRAIRELGEKGVILGVFPDEGYINYQFELRSGDRVLLYTDGIIEAASPAEEFFGEERLREFMIAYEALPAESFAEALLQEVSRWPGMNARGIQTDDLTLVAVDIKG